MSRSFGKILIVNDHLILELIEDPNYEVRKDGTVWTLIATTGKKSTVWRESGWIDQQGYRRVKYKKKMLAVHRIIYAKFGISPLSQDLVVNHIDSNRSNNDIQNLEHVTHLENCLHGIRAKNSALIQRK